MPTSLMNLKVLLPFQVFADKIAQRTGMTIDVEKTFAAADTDKNETVTALEAYRYAAQKTTAFYESQKRIATEHPMLEDSGKGEGVRDPKPEEGQGRLAAAFTLLRFGAAQAAAKDPAKQKLLVRKEEVEQQIDKLKYEKAAMDASQYKKDLAKLLLELARLQEEIDK